jgi:radical SAM-linked protein
MTGFRPAGAAGVSGISQRLIVRYAKRGRMRFASHRDVARAVERGVRRAGLPIAYSAGFTPHPKISYAGAAPTGTASEAEYLELSLTQRCDPPEVRERLSAALPDGIDVIEVTETAASLGALPLEASQWRVILPGVPRQEAERAVAAFLGCQAVPVDRLTSKGTRSVDARAAVVSIDVTGEPDVIAGDGGTVPGNAVLRMVVRHVVPAVRPDDVLTALRHVAALTPPSPPLVTRLVQGAITDVVAAAAAVGGRDAVPPGPAVSFRGDGAPELSAGDPGAADSARAAGDARRREAASSGPSGPTVFARGGTVPAPGARPNPGGPENSEAGPGAALGRGVPAVTVQTTRPGEGTTATVGTHPAGACNQLLRGADGPPGAAAPGSSTGDSPDARERAARQRIGR